VPYPGLDVRFTNGLFSYSLLSDAGFIAMYATLASRDVVSMNNPYNL